jgi:hydrogenase maturation protease
MTASVVVIGVGNRYRRDDGVGPAVAAAISERALPGVRVLVDIADPVALLDAWSGASLAVVIDAAIGYPPSPGRLRRCAVADIATCTTMSSHAIDIASTVSLGLVLSRMPGEMVLFTIEAADTGHGEGLTPQVAAAVPKAADAVVAYLCMTSRADTAIR